jgi:hypothetical protein
MISIQYAWGIDNMDISSSQLFQQLYVGWDLLKIIGSFEVVEYFIRWLMEQYSTTQNDPIIFNKY